MADLEAYDAKLAPGPFGFANLASNCYFNAVLQALAGCTAFLRAVTASPEYMRRTATGAAVLEFADAITGLRGAAGARDVEGAAVRILGALGSDLAARRACGVRSIYGRAGQDGALEAVSLLLDMLEPPVAPNEPAGPLEELRAADGDTACFAQAVSSPITPLFNHRYREELYCRSCRQVVSVPRADEGQYIDLDRGGAPPGGPPPRPPPQDAEAFARAIQLFARNAPGYRCPKCGQTNACAHVYRLTLAPEILICAFGIYVEHGGERRARFVPERFALPTPRGGGLAYRLVGQVEHHGGLEGGHYRALGLRDRDEVYLFDDTSFSRARFAATADTYFVVYHFEGHIPATGA